MSYQLCSVENIGVIKHDHLIICLARTALFGYSYYLYIIFFLILHY